MIFGNPEKGSNPVLTIDCTSLNVADPAGIPSNHIIMETDPWEVSVDWEFDGFLAKWLVALNIPYTVTFFYEGVGGAPDGTLGKVNSTTNAGQTAYKAVDTTFKVAAGTLPAGIYELTAVVSFNGNPPVTAFNESKVQIF